MRLLVAGSRNFNDFTTFSRVMDKLLDGIGEVTIVEGGAKGADTMAREYAENRGIAFVEMRANWALYGKAAGCKRNEQMVSYVAEEGGVALYFWDMTSRGTANCIRHARKAGLKVIIYDTTSNQYAA